MTRAVNPLGAVFTDTTPGTTTDGIGAGFTLNSRGHGFDGSEWIYVQASAALTQGMCVAITDAGQAAPATKALVDAGRRIAFAANAFADNDFGWVFTRSGVNTASNATSPYRVRVLASCLPNKRLYTSGTAGSLDDASASQTIVNSVAIRATAGASAAAGNGLVINAFVQDAFALVLT